MAPPAWLRPMHALAGAAWGSPQLPGRELGFTPCLRRLQRQQWTPLHPPGCVAAAKWPPGFLCASRQPSETPGRSRPKYSQCTDSAAAASSWALECCCWMPAPGEDPRGKWEELLPSLASELVASMCTCAAGRLSSKVAQAARTLPASAVVVRQLPSGAGAPRHTRRHTHRGDSTPGVQCTIRQAAAASAPHGRAFVWAARPVGRPRERCWQLPPAPAGAMPAC